jgi:hypothetical protein
MSKTLTNIQVIQSIRKPLAPTETVMQAKKNKYKSDKVGRKSKHKKRWNE